MLAEDRGAPGSGRRRVSIILPAFEEQEGIGRLLEEISSTLSPYTSKYDIEVVAVVDYSPREGDATCRRAEEKAGLLRERGIGFRCVLRKYERGLASAVARGFEEARKGDHRDDDILVVMDADGQHPPDTIPQLVESLDEADLVVASRFYKESRIEGLSWYRLLMSKISILVLRKIVCGASKTTDPLSGFFAIRRGKIPAGRLKPRGYKILLEILGRDPTLSVKDVPFTFRERKANESKLNLTVMLDGLVQLVDLSRIHVFALVGLLGMIINLAVMYVLLSLLLGVGVEYLYAVVISSIGGIVASITSNFVLHERVTFRTRCRVYEGIGCLSRYLHYFLVSIVSIIVTVATATLFAVAGLNPVAGQALGIILGFAANWVLSTSGFARVRPVWKCEWTVGGPRLEAGDGGREDQL